MAFKREGRLSDFEHGYKTLLARKNQIIKKYNTKELEDQIKFQIQALSIQPELIFALIPRDPGQNGILYELDQY